MALLGSNLTGELLQVGLRLLLCPLGSNIVIRTACCSVGIALPVYSTFKAIENRDQNAQRKCLLYWAAYGSFSLVEVFTDKLISWFPMYYHIKFAFLVWLQLPSTDIKLVSSYQAEIQFVRSMVVKISGSADHMLGGTTESDRSRQPNPSEDPAVPSDAEPDQNNN
nr:HVA22-like protein k isoform X4 [Arachis hypogaea]